MDKTDIECPFCNTGSCQYCDSDHMKKERNKFIKDELIRFCMWEWYKPSFDIDQLKNVCSEKVNEYLKDNEL